MQDKNQQLDRALELTLQMPARNEKEQLERAVAVANVRQCYNWSMGNNGGFEPFWGSTTSSTNHVVYRIGKNQHLPDNRRVGTEIEETTTDNLNDWLHKTEKTLNAPVSIVWFSRIPWPVKK